MKNIVIIGGGFSGTMTAINLARLSSVPLHISILNKSRVSCRGTAYSTQHESHLLNVVARNMSALADQPNHFVEWLGTRAEYLDVPVPVLREKFVPRKIYGDYLCNVFHWYSGILAVEKGMRLELVHGEASDIVPGVPEGEGTSVVLTDGRVLAADKVVLAAGNQPPANFRLPGLDTENRHYIANPWTGWEAKLPPADQDVLLIGTGLTMVDTFLTLQDLGWRGRIHAVSRHGLLPFSHFKGFEYADILEDRNTTIPLRKIFSLFKKHYREVTARNLNPATLVDKLRPFTQRIWQNFSLFEKKQFDRHFRTRWNVMRHRIAPEVHKQLLDAIAQDRLEVIQGRLCECGEPVHDRVKVCVGNKEAKRELEVGVLINCTGPRESYVSPEPDLFGKLFSRGLIQKDAMDMGIETAADFSVINSEGTSQEGLFALGSILKGSLWETTAVPELRSQAFRVAETISSQIAENIAQRSPIWEVVADVIEYSI